MDRAYSNMFRKKMASKVADEHGTPSRTAEKFGIPLKTLEKWTTAYRKNPSCFDKPDNEYKIARYKKAHKYDRLRKKELIHECKIRDAQIDCLISILQANGIQYIEKNDD